MELQVIRHAFKPTYTIGKLYIDGKYFCDTLEDVVRKGPKVMHETAIPAGTYEVILNVSPRFGKVLPRLLNVPGLMESSSTQGTPPKTPPVVSS